MRRDRDLEGKSEQWLRRELKRVRHRTRVYADKEENARCHHEEKKLIAAILPEKRRVGRMCGDPDVILRECKRYIRRQQCDRNGPCPNA